MGILKAQNLHKRYQLGKENYVYALRGASLEVDEGDIVAIMGPSGSGKSTIMHLMGCLDRPDEGEVWLSGRRVDNMRGRALNSIRGKEIGFIFQGFNLVPTLSALDNVSLAAEYAGISRRKSAELARNELEDVGLGDRLGHKPSELSGGEQQRVAIARALVNNPKIVLGDEPTGDLDTATSDEIVEMMQDINSSKGTTFVLVTHDPEVGTACHRVINMRDGEVLEQA
jgi:putative ABC transport system ATP-binding protein